MAGYCSTGQSPQRAVVLMEEEEEEEEEEETMPYLQYVEVLTHFKCKQFEPVFYLIFNCKNADMCIIQFAIRRDTQGLCYCQKLRNYGKM
jgi:hypothetical protein